MMRATSLFLSVTVAILPATGFARGGGGGHSSSSHSSSGRTASHYSYGSHSSGGRSQAALGGRPYHSTRVSSHADHIDSTVDHEVRSYYRKNGEFVQSYHATNPNSTRLDNYSTIGNVNPYTGMPGTKPAVQP
jgi:hypothetical protein